MPDAGVFRADMDDAFRSMRKKYMSDLDDILNGEESVESVEPVEGVVEPTEAAEETEEVTEPEGEPEKAEEDGETPAPKDEPEESWTKAAVLDERRKRQALERELEELRKPKDEQERPDVFEDPEKAFQHTEKSIEQKLLNQKIEMSQELMRSMHEDYDECEVEFIDLAKQSPSLIQEMNSHPMPAKFVRDTVLKQRNLSEVDNVPTYKQRIAELEAQLAEVKKAPAVPQSLANKGSKGGLNTDHIKETLDEILGS